MTYIPPVHLPVSDLPPDEPAAFRMRDQLGGPEVLSVARRAFQPAGLCFWNVEVMRRQGGGQMLPGWMLEWVPGVYVQAIHHAVWKKTDGTLLDPTATQNGRQTTLTTFVPDDSVDIDLTWPIMEENRHLVLVEDTDVDAALTAYRRNNALAKGLYTACRAAGTYTWHPVKGLAGKGPEYDEYTERTLGELRSTFQEQHSRNALIKARYFPFLA